MDWCSLSDVTENLEPKIKRKSKFDENSQYFDTVLKTSKWDDSRPDHSLDFLYMFIVAFVGMLFIAYLTSIMFCRVKGLRPEDEEPNDELLNHRELRRASAQMRRKSSL